MPQQELLKKVVRVLTENNIPYMLTGSLASSLQGEPRSTHDINIVVALPQSAIEKLRAAFPSPDYYLDKESIIQAMSTQGMFNLLNSKEGDKVDFWMLTDTPFDQSRFSRRIIERVMEIELNVSSPEDTILAKLKWAQESGGSEKQFIDALRVYEMQYGKLDLNYVERWIKELGLAALWQRLNDEAQLV